MSDSEAARAAIGALPPNPPQPPSEEAESATAPTESTEGAIPGLGNLGSLATTIHNLIQQGISIDEAAQKVARFVDPALVPALQTLATVLQAVEKYV